MGLGPGLEYFFPVFHRALYTDGVIERLVYEAELAEVHAEVEAVRTTGASAVAAREHWRLVRSSGLRITRWQASAARQVSMLGERIAVMAIASAMLLFAAWRAPAWWMAMGSGLVALVGMSQLSGGVQAGWAWPACIATLQGVAMRFSVRSWRRWGAAGADLTAGVAGAPVAALIASRLEPSLAWAALVAVPLAVVAPSTDRFRRVRAWWVLPLAGAGWVWLGGPEAHELATAAACVAMAASATRA